MSDPRIRQHLGAEMRDVLVPVGEHIHTNVLHEATYYPDHAARTESKLFRETKRKMQAEGIYQCAVCGDDEKIESHHRWIEWAYAKAIHWVWIKAVALGQTDEMWSHKLRRIVKIPPRHLIWRFLRDTEGFDWAAFDPANPESFVDSEYNQDPLCEQHHRAPHHGIHEESYPVYVVQAFLLPDFVYSPDELRAAHVATNALPAQAKP
ncbi:hypothetical protein [Chromobacterium amazonense]|nr:hypothetical protein [Chromobacterium amazonense]